MSIIINLVILFFAIVAFDNLVGWRLRKKREEKTTSSQSFEPCTMLYAVDGDTIDVLRIDGSQARVRLIGIDAPESLHPDPSKNTPAGEAATKFARSICIPGSTVYLESDIENRDQYGRLLRHVWLASPDRGFANANMAALMLRYGHAKLDTHFPNMKHTAQLVRIALANA